jgi:hypothetical protein
MFYTIKPNTSPPFTLSRNPAGPPPLKKCCLPGGGAGGVTGLVGGFGSDLSLNDKSVFV